MDFCVRLLTGLVCLLSLAAGAAPSAAADYPNRPVKLADRLHRRRPGRYRGADHGQWLSEHFGQQFVVENRAGSGGNIAAAAAISFAAGRLYAAVRRAQQRDLDLALQEAAVRFHPRHRAGREHHAAHQHDGGAECDCRSKPSRSSSTTARPIPARSPMPHPATAPRCTCRRNCSRR